ncbi:hypothetical protein [Halegenticoccus tardaugens]|uniref:hypothetical protein n=1 Tax=Halegenticoccus tardaugens TaxID=2071624 RepID=UPI00100B06B9|nr:hypothetical protein [Halegenticoccus tardaugens]
MANPTAVKRALRALAERRDRRGGRDYRDEIRAGADAMDAVVDAAAFCEGHDDGGRRGGNRDGDGLRRLRAAVRAAERRGDRDAARRGQRALAVVERYRRTVERCRRVAGEPRTDTAVEPADDDGIRRPDHFRPGRTTILPGRSQGWDR